MESYRRQAEQMVEAQLRRRGIADEAVLAAMRAVPRHMFVPAGREADAYADVALPTAEGQTISQPYIVGRMTELLQVRPGQRVLEVGTGSGYQAAILGQMGATVLSIESRPALADSARLRLEHLGVRDLVEVVVADGTLGYAAGAPYDRIIVTAGAPHLPRALRAQLADGGCCVAPIGDMEIQFLVRFQRRADRWHEERDIACRFVPLLGADGWPGD